MEDIAERACTYQVVLWQLVSCRCVAIGNAYENFNNTIGRLPVIVSITQKALKLQQIYTYVTIVA